MPSFNFNMKAVLLAVLTAEDSVDLANFDCGDEELNCFLQEEALDEQEQKLNKTILLYYKGELAAYCSLCADNIRLSDSEMQDSSLTRKVVPAIKIARLARDKNFTEMGFGRFLIKYAIKLANDLTDSMGMRFITVDAYPDKLKFYSSVGFVPNESYQSRTQNVSMRLDILTTARLP
jgi:predicted GNAT family N-acyltransferase